VSLCHAGAISAVGKNSMSCSMRYSMHCCNLRDLRVIYDDYLLHISDLQFLQYWDFRKDEFGFKPYFFRIARTSAG
jgi:hypothetical protein